MDTDDGMEKEYEKKAILCLKRQLPAHIITKKDSWLNGYVIEVSSDFLIILDRYAGEFPVFYKEIRLFDFFRGDHKTLKKFEDKKDDNAV